MPLKNVDLIVLLFKKLKISLLIIIIMIAIVEYLLIVIFKKNHTNNTNKIVDNKTYIIIKSNLF